MKEQKLNKLKKKIISAVPSILDLKFGLTSNVSVLELKYG